MIGTRNQLGRVDKQTVIEMVAREWTDNEEEMLLITWR